MTTKVGRLTYEEWLQLPETKQKCEVVDGVVFMPPGPLPEHQWTQQEVFARCREFSRASGLGIFMHAPLDLVVQREPLRVRQPDIMFFNSERTGIRSIRDVAGRSPLDASPDIVIEVLSPSNTAREMERRLADFKLAGAYQCWLFDPVALTASILDLTGDEPRQVAVFGIEDTLTSAFLPGFELRLSEIFD